MAPTAPDHVSGSRRPNRRSTIATFCGSGTRRTRSREIEHAWLFDHLMPIFGDPTGPPSRAGPCCQPSPRRPNDCASGCW